MSANMQEDPTPLHGAVKQGDAATAQFLIAAGVDTRKRDKVSTRLSLLQYVTPSLANGN
jgi:ankyrin repeat protein